MKISTKSAPPNSLILIKDIGNAEIPPFMSQALIASTSSCIAVGCLSEMDGETNFTLGPTLEVDPGYSPAFEGKLVTPSRQIALQSVLGAIILKQSVSQSEVIVRIWVNDENEPDNVTVGITSTGPATTAPTWAGSSRATRSAGRSSARGPTCTPIARTTTPT